LTATLTIIASFLPLVSLTGGPGEFIIALPLTVAIGLACSFAVAMLLTPLLARFFIEKGLHSGDGKKKFDILDFMQAAYNRAITFLMARKFIAIGMGVAGVIALYTLVAFVCLRTLGAEGLARTSAPALEVMTRTLGRRGALAIAAGVSVSTLGFLSQSILTAPRVYFAMAGDGLFFGAVARVHERTRAPIVAIALQGALAIAIALAGTFEAITRYVVSIDFVFFALTAACVFVFRRRGVRGTFTMPGHPVTTAAFIAICAAVVLSTWRADPLHAFAGLGITAAGIPAFLLWRSRIAATAADQPGPPAPPR